MDFLIKNGKLVRALGDKGLSEEEVRVPDHVAAIGDYAFSHIGISTVHLPKTVTSIGLGAFSGCNALESVNIPEGVSYIGREAFSCCSLLREISIPTRVTRLNDGCFRDCLSLKTVRLHENIIYGGDVFVGCGALERVDIGGVSIRSKMFAIALKLDPSSIERLTRAVRYGTIPDRVHGALNAQLAAQLYIQRRGEDVKKYLRRNAVSVFGYLAADGRSDLMIQLAGEKDIVTRDIDALIETAIAARQHEVYIMLTDLRHGAAADTVTDRFAL